MYLNIHIPTHTNIGIFFGGLFSGMIFMKIKAHNFDVHKSKAYMFMFHLSLPLSIGVTLLGYIFYVNDFDKSSLWVAVYATIARNSWGFLIGIFFVSFACGLGGKCVIECDNFMN